MRSEQSNPTDWFVSWLNPFAAAVAEAQTAFNVVLTPATGYSPTGPSGMHAFGITKFANTQTFALNCTAYGGGYNTERCPYVYFQTTFPAQGTYMIDIEASPGLIKLRHQTDTPDKWDVWDQNYQ